MDIIYAYTSTAPGFRNCFRFSAMPCPEGVSPSLPADCEVLRTLASRHLRELSYATGISMRLRHCMLQNSFCRTPKTITDILERSGIPALPGGWYRCGDEAASAAMHAAGEGCPGTITRTLSLPRENNGKDDTLIRETKKPTRKINSGTVSRTHGAADALDWDEAMGLVRSTYLDGKYTESMLVAAGCFLGLRISDLLRLRWADVCRTGSVTVSEKKTGKKRKIKVNETLARHASLCREALRPEDPEGLVFRSWYRDDGLPISRQRACQMLSELKDRYSVKSARTFSTHSLRKTFGRRVWQVQCEKGRGEQALLLLCDVFGHSNINITKRYLGIREEEILSVYDDISAARPKHEHANG